MPDSAWTRRSEHVATCRSTVTVGVVHAGGEALLVDPDGPAAADAARDRGLEPTRALYTHYHRDVAGGARALAREGIEIVVPEAEREYFEHPGSFWRDPDYRWHRYDFRPDRLLPARPIPVDATVAPGETIERSGADVEVVPTPGHTEYGVAYRVSADGREEAFVGDAICGDGRLWDAYSLQRSRGTHHDYHAFLGDRGRLLDGLEAIADADAFVPLRGDPIERPAAAVERLRRRLTACYGNYARIAALRHYFPDLFAADERAMPAREPKPIPESTRHAGTTWVLLGDDGSALVMDCGDEAVLDRLAEWEDEGVVDGVDALWITHYHDDHVDAVPAFLDRYDPPVLAQEHVADVIERPEAYRLPCGSPGAVSVDRRLADGERWRWRGWDLEARRFPGQTYYHAALLAVGDGKRLLFAGDSFTPAGLDDYCTYNRNLLGEGRGYDRCLRLVGELEPTHVFNPHVERPFTFTDTQRAFMRSALADRAALFADLLAWEHPNQGLDPDWIRCFPYDQILAPDETGTVEVVVTNYLDEEQEIAARPDLPTGPGGWVEGRAAPESESRLELAVELPPDAEPGVEVVPFDVRWGGRTLRRFREARVLVE